MAFLTYQVRIKTAVFEACISGHTSLIKCSDSGTDSSCSWVVYFSPLCIYTFFLTEASGVICSWKHHSLRAPGHCLQRSLARIVWVDLWVAFPGSGQKVGLVDHLVPSSSTFQGLLSCPEEHRPDFSSTSSQTLQWERLPLSPFSENALS